MKKLLSFLTAFLFCASAQASLIAIPNIYAPGQTLPAATLNSNFSTIYNDYNGNITNANIAASAGIVLSKISLSPGGEAFNALATSGGITWASGLTTDTQPRIALDSDGSLVGGPGGTTVPDVGFKRSAPGTWQLQSPSGTPSVPVLDLNGGSIVNGVGFVPYGTVVAWFSTSNSIPTGWALCNGQTTTWQSGPFAGTSVTVPNLIGMFVVGGDITGGSSTGNANGFGSLGNQTQMANTTHTHTYTGTTSAASANVANCVAGAGNVVSQQGHSHTFSGTTSTTTSQPSSYTLVYILKL